MFKAMALPVIILFVLSNLIGCKVSESTEKGDASAVETENQTLANNDSSSSSIASAENFSQENDCATSVLDEEILIKVNEARAQARMCGDTHYDAVSPVILSCALKKAALNHSVDMGENNFFSHTGSDGLRVGQRVDAQNYDWSMVGENIARGQTSGDEVINAWLASPGHCSTIMGEDFEQTATAVHLPEDSDYLVYWTMVMAK